MTVGGEEDLVWYVAYGSNLSSARFRRYLDGCRDPSPARRWVAVELPHRLLFARHSALWDGSGVAFIDPATDPAARTRGRAWLLTGQQFADVLAQECGLPVGSVTAPAWDNRPVVAYRGHWYGCIVPLGWREASPMVTFTDEAAATLTPNAPGVAYRAVVADGLTESHGLRRQEADAYLDAHIS